MTFSLSKRGATIAERRSRATMLAWSLYRASVRASTTSRLWRWCSTVRSRVWLRRRDSPAGSAGRAARTGGRSSVSSGAPGPECKSNASLRAGMTFATAASSASYSSSLGRGMTRKFPVSSSASSSWRPCRAPSAGSGRVSSHLSAREAKRASSSSARGGRSAVGGDPGERPALPPAGVPATVRLTVPSRN